MSLVINVYGGVGADSPQPISSRAADLTLIVKTPVEVGMARDWIVAQVQRAFEKPPLPLHYVDEDGDRVLLDEIDHYKEAFLIALERGKDLKIVVDSPKHNLPSRQDTVICAPKLTRVLSQRVSVDDVRGERRSSSHSQVHDREEAQQQRALQMNERSLGGSSSKSDCSHSSDHLLQQFGQLLTQMKSEMVSELSRLIDPSPLVMTTSSPTSCTFCSSPVSQPFLSRTGRTLCDDCVRVQCKHELVVRKPIAITGDSSDSRDSREDNDEIHDFECLMLDARIDHESPVQLMHSLDKKRAAFSKQFTITNNGMAPWHNVCLRLVSSTDSEMTPLWNSCSDVHLDCGRATDLVVCMYACKTTSSVARYRLHCDGIDFGPELRFEIQAGDYGQGEEEESEDSEFDVISRQTIWTDSGRSSPDLPAILDHQEDEPNAGSVSAARLAEEETPLLDCSIVIPHTPHPLDLMGRLREMGFRDDDANRAAIAAANGEIENAVHLLLGDH